MGVNIFRRSSDANTMNMIRCNCKYTKTKAKVSTTPNPNPYKFVIEKYMIYGNYILVKINYPDCITFNGNKILVYEDVTVSDLQLTNILDPHFGNDDKNIYPIARFIPTKKGWELAKQFCEKINK